MKKIVIYGASSLMAYELAKIYALQKAQILLVARSQKKLETLKNDLEIRGAQVFIQVADLNLIENHAGLIEEAQKIIGPEIHIIFCFQGHLSEQSKAQEDMNYMCQEIHCNFLAPASLLSLWANIFEKKRMGHLVAITSVAGDRGRQSNYIYGSAKGGLSIFMQGLRNRLYSHDVFVSTLKPGFVDTPMTAHLKKGPLFSSASKAAQSIYKAVQRKQDVSYIPSFWWAIMTIIKSIPEFLFKRLRL